MTIAEDSVAERVENFTVLLIPIAEGITLAPGQERATVQIIDNDCKSLVDKGLSVLM